MRTNRWATGDGRRATGDGRWAMGDGMVRGGGAAKVEGRERVCGCRDAMRARTQLCHRVFVRACVHAFVRSCVAWVRARKEQTTNRPVSTATRIHAFTYYETHQTETDTTLSRRKKNPIHPSSWVTSLGNNHPAKKNPSLEEIK